METRSYFVTNCNGMLAVGGHDLDLPSAQAVLNRELEGDPRNKDEWEILQADYSEDI